MEKLRVHSYDGPRWLVLRRYEGGWCVFDRHAQVAISAPLPLLQASLLLQKEEA